MKIIEENEVSTPDVEPKTNTRQATPPAPPTPPKSYVTAGNIYLGAVLALVGLLWLGHNYHIICGLASEIIFSVWMLMIAIGGYLLILRKTTSGLIVALIGAVMLLTDKLDLYISFSRIILPIMLIIVGVCVICSQQGRKK